MPGCETRSVYSPFGSSERQENVGVSEYDLPMVGAYNTRVPKPRDTPPIWFGRRAGATAEPDWRRIARLGHSGVVRADHGQVVFADTHVFLALGRSEGRVHAARLAARHGRGRGL